MIRLCNVCSKTLQVQIPAGLLNFYQDIGVVYQCRACFATVNSETPEDIIARIRLTKKGKTEPRNRTKKHNRFGEGA